MLTLISSVIFISLSGVISPGPLLAILITKSHRSAWAGTRMALGHAVVEVPLILIILYGFGAFFQYTLTQMALSIAGGGVIIWMGVSLFRNRKAIIRGEKDTRYSPFVSGIMMTGLNPFFLLWWFTVGSLWIMKFSVLGVTGMITFIVVHWLCDLVWLTFVSNAIYHTHSFWKAGVQEWIFIGCGLILTGFGVWFIGSGVMWNAPR